MPMNFADDLAVFFDPEEHGEAIRYNGVGGFSAIWNRPTGDLEVNGGSFVVATNTFMLPITQIAQPVVLFISEGQTSTRQRDVHCDGSDQRDGQRAP